MNNRTRGIVESNTVIWTTDYARDTFSNGLSDCGAIYTYKFHDRLIIRDNLISGFNGWKMSVGIYIDGYASNIKVYGNVVLNSGDSQSIRLYNDYSPNTGVEARNNLLMYNVVK